MGCLKRYDSVQDILKEFFELRLQYYKLRKDWLLGSLGAEAAKLSNQARFVLEKIEGKVTIGKKRVFINPQLDGGFLFLKPHFNWRVRDIFHCQRVYKDLKVMPRLLLPNVLYGCKLALTLRIIVSRQRTSRRGS